MEECVPTVYLRDGRWFWTCRHGGARRGKRYGRGFGVKTDAVYASVQHWRRMALNITRDRFYWTPDGQCLRASFWGNP